MELTNNKYYDIIYDIFLRKYKRRNIDDKSTCTSSIYN